MIGRIILTTYLTSDEIEKFVENTLETSHEHFINLIQKDYRKHSDIIYCAFDWELTPEGPLYWIAIKRRINLGIKKGGPKIGPLESIKKHTFK